jgi:glycerol-1-phosphate dehydrogenase [NAD(P)+]
MVIGDLDILSDAPLPLSAAGFGDIMGKVTARMDWKLSNIAFGEDMCSEIEGLANSAVTICLDLSDEINMRTYESTQGLMEALTLSGIAMQLQGNSRPASGAEHHMAHFLEMRDGHKVRKGAYHGAVVGITTPIAMRFYEKFFEAGPPPQGVVPEKMETKAKAAKAYGEVWDNVLRNKGEIYIQPDKWREIRDRVENRWNELKTDIEGFDSLRKSFAQTLKECGAPSHPKDLGYTKEDIYDAMMYARMLRKRPTILSVLANWGYLEKYATEIIDELY